MTRGGGSKNRIRVTMLQELVFSESSLPATIELAAAFRPYIDSRLRGTPSKWPFDDRVLVWLIPSLRKDVVRFHEVRGPAMDEVFGRQQLSNLDSHFFKTLAFRLEKIYPGTIKELLELEPRDPGPQKLPGRGRPRYGRQVNA